MEIHLLDMGTTKFGDSILITHNDRKILIDGAHRGDLNNIRLQLGKILGTVAPFDIDLLVITHCHSDHIGCLPDLVKLGDLRTKWALLADENIGFGNPMDQPPGTSDGKNTLFTALDEEDHSDLEGDEMDQFLFDAANLQSGYHDLVEKLKTDLGVKARIFTGVEDGYQDIENEFRDFGLKILGPTKDHLKLCEEYLSKSIKNNPTGTDSSPNIPLTDFISIAKIYKDYTKKLKSDSAGLQDRVGPGAAKNDSSIVISVEADGLKALLTGDMQFGVSEIPGLNNKMVDLLKLVNAGGPYQFIKFAHHTSYNGLGNDGHVLDNWLSAGTTLYAHSGGLQDTTHPDPNMLSILESKKSDLFFARTDRNGIITVRKKTKPEMLISRGDFNDFSPNKKLTDETPSGPKPNIIPKTIPINSPQTISSTQTNESLVNDIVEVITKVPNQDMKVTISIEIEKKKSKTIGLLPNIPATIDPSRFGNLLFITCSIVLQENIGQRETASILNFLQSIPNASFLDLPKLENTDRVASLLSPYLNERIKGVVIIGGYDVIPPVQLDVLTLEHRRKLSMDGFDSHNDLDNFIVYSDDIYGDRDEDLYPEIPVSRIPDGRKAETLNRALQAPWIIPGAKFGLRNIARPFADLTYGAVPGPNNNIFISERFNPDNMQSDMGLGAVYLMLHGADGDATRFWGETQGGLPTEAMRIENIPKSTPGTVVFTGCCWGALTALPTAFQKSAHTAYRPRTQEQSMALTYLASGANAYIGCTGSHYSPDKPPYNYFGKPMHDEFWQGILEGKAPSLALFEAKKKYAAKMPHDLVDSFSKAVEFKILREYTCLGLGW